MAREKELDLIEIAPKARPPVCRIMDYGKYQYQKSKDEKKQKAKQKKTVVRLALKTDDVAVRSVEHEKAGDEYRPKSGREQQSAHECPTSG